MRRKLIAVALAVAASMSGVGAGTASAATPSPQAVHSINTSGIKIWPKVTYHWWGIQVRFTRWQTESIAVGTADAIGLAIAGYGSMLANPLVVPATRAIGRGLCLEANYRYVGPSNTWYYSCS